MYLEVLLFHNGYIYYLVHTIIWFILGSNTITVQGCGGLLRIIGGYTSTGTFNICHLLKQVFFSDLVQGIGFRFPLGEIEGNSAIELTTPSEKEAGVEFFLFNRESSARPANFADLKPQNPVKLLVHGWNETSEVDWFRDMTNAYLQVGDYNVITTDWTKWARLQYPSAVFSAKEPGEAIGK